VWETVFRIRLAHAGTSQDIHQWVNGGLMTIFVLVVGLGARRELDLGELRDRRGLAVRVAGALGGMLVPVAIHLAINGQRTYAGGWGAAMSTDTTSTLGMLAAGRPVLHRQPACICPHGGGRRRHGLFRRDRHCHAHTVKIVALLVGLGILAVVALARSRPGFLTIRRRVVALGERRGDRS
jgi:hypothetical protein